MTVRDLYYLKARRPSVTDLHAQITSTGATTPGGAGGFRVVFRNSGPVGGPDVVGAVGTATFSANIGLAPTAVVSVTYAGGADGPATITVAQLASSGLVFTSLPRNGAATINVEFTNSATLGVTYSANAVIVVPGGITDSNPANNTATASYTLAHTPASSSGPIYLNVVASSPLPGGLPWEDLDGGGAFQIQSSQLTGRSLTISGFPPDVGTKPGGAVLWRRYEFWANSAAAYTFNANNTTDYTSTIAPSSGGYSNYLATISSTIAPNFYEIVFRAQVQYADGSIVIISHVGGLLSVI